MGTAHETVRGGTDLAHRAVWKFPLTCLTATTTVEMPVGASIVHVHQQHGVPTIWAEVDSSAPRVKRTFGTCATGQPLPLGVPAKYVGTVHDDWLVWHIYEITPLATLVSEA